MFTKFHLKGQPSHIVRHSSALPGDNPVYELNEGITSTAPQHPTANIRDTSQSFNRDRSESAPDREFDNPIYGMEGRENVYSDLDLDTNQTEIGTGSTLHHKFDNPVYGGITDKTTYSMLSVANDATTEIAN